jgi:NAD(P)-dependent dehydrogenase (short-subunit alcohol dehydrogenase family)
MAAELAGHAGGQPDRGLERDLVRRAAHEARRRADHQRDLAGRLRGEPAHPAYGASKAGLNALGQSLAAALAPLGISVTSVAPGYVETEMAAADLNSARGDEIRAQSPFNRAAQPGEIAAAILYLASDQAEWASGAIVDLNGASYLRS